MIARPKISRNERKPTEIGAFEVGNFAPFAAQVPTLYLDGKFKHERDFLGVYARGFLRTAFEAAGRDFPEPDAPPSPRVGEQLDAAPRHNSQG